MNEFWTATAASITRRISALFHSSTFRRFSGRCKQLVLIRFFCTCFFFFFPHFVSSSSLPRLPCLITESIKKAIKHHAGNMYNPLNKSWIKYANSNNGMLISVPFCLHYWFSRVRARPCAHKWQVKYKVHRYFFYAEYLQRNFEGNSTFHESFWEYCCTIWLWDNASRL